MLEQFVNGFASVGLSFLLFIISVVAFFLKWKLAGSSLLLIGLILFVIGAIKIRQSLVLDETNGQLEPEEKY